jgi:hypothetical protein
MSIWVRAVCRASVSGVTPGELRAGIIERLAPMAVLYGESDHEAAAARVRVEAESASSAEAGGFGVYRLYFRGEGDARSVRVERWAEPARVKEKAARLLEAIEDCDEDDVDVVESAIAEVVEIVGFELTVSDTEGMGWPVVIAAAAYLADRGHGLIQADGEGWMAPKGRDVEHLIDAD